MSDKSMFKLFWSNSNTIGCSDDKTQLSYLDFTIRTITTNNSWDFISLNCGVIGPLCCYLARVSHRPDMRLLSAGLHLYAVSAWHCLLNSHNQHQSVVTLKRQSPREMDYFISNTLYRFVLSTQRSLQHNVMFVLLLSHLFSIAEL